MDGIDAAGKIRTHQNVPIIFVTSHAHGDYLKKAKQIRPEGYVLKPFNEAQVEAVIEMALGSDDYQTQPHNENPSMKNREDPDRDAHLQEKLLKLTTAEWRVAKLIKRGKRTREIASRMNVSCSTVDWHRKNIRKKLGLTGIKIGLMGKLMSIL